MMIDRSIDLFDIPHANAKHGTTHIHAYLRADSDKHFTVYVAAYREDGPVRIHPLMASAARRVERFGRFSEKRLTALANDPEVMKVARALAGLEN